MTKWLVAFDTDQIKQYVFRTPTLKEIRGASALLDRLNRTEMRKLVGGDCIYANGGGGLFVIDAQDPNAAIDDVRRLYTTLTHSASITGAAVPLPTDPNAVHQALALLRHRLRAAKGVEPAATSVVSHPLFRFCDVCGNEHAEFEQKVDQTIEYVCRSCDAKRAENRAVQVRIEPWLAGKPPDTEQLWGKLIAGLGAQGYPLRGSERPETFEALGELSSPRGYMGLIYADGDGMGSVIESISSLDELRRFSAAVDGALHAAVADAVAANLPPADVLPFDVLLLGGDDLVMVTAANRAIETAVAIVERFGQLTEQRWGQPLRLSASVTLTHTSYPVGSLIHLAESGLRFAKRESALRRLQPGGAAAASGLVNFLVVNSPNHSEFDRYYQETLRAKEGQEVILRTLRPYTPQEMRELIDKARAAKQTPRAKLEQLRAAVFKSRRQATLDAMKATLRLRNAEQRKALFALIGSSEQEQINLPWVRRANGWATPILDVVELLDFIE